MCTSNPFQRDGPLRGDASDLMEIFGNVLENACKFCRGRVLELAAGSAAICTSQVACHVEDDGAGIAVDDRQQVAAWSACGQPRPGQGIGLSVTAELVDLYQGELTMATAIWGR
ncbi:MAG: hypothetical protein CM15mP120_11990 [Pseudomonadota bacterium]|nr:MAG: hypothetical protein CM15mP120_11990 [Pseudomonadota bacterium]